MRALRTPFDWWVGNVACLRDLVQLAGFPRPRPRRLFRLRARRPIRQWHVVLEAARP
jgi:hypothetical protein